MEKLLLRFVKQNWTVFHLINCLYLSGKWSVLVFQTGHFLLVNQGKVMLNYLKENSKPRGEKWL